MKIGGSRSIQLLNSSYVRHLVSHQKRTSILGLDLGLIANTVHLHALSADLSRNINDVLVMCKIDSLSASAHPFHDAAG